MASINNLSQVAEDLLQQATLVDTEIPDIKEFTVDDGGDGIKVLVSDKVDVDLSVAQAEAAMLTGNEDLNIVANDNSNFIVGNAGNNTIATGAGDDQIDAGEGNDTVVVDGDGDKVVTLGAGDDKVVTLGVGDGVTSNNEVFTGSGNDSVTLGSGDDQVIIDGPGVKNIDAGAGNDLFVIEAGASGSQSTFTNLNVGDRVRVTVKDTNGDGQLGFDDIQGVAADADGNAVFTLKDGTSFTLVGVGPDAATNGAIAYDIVNNQDGSFDVVLRSSLDVTYT